MPTATQVRADITSAIKVGLSHRDLNEWQNKIPKSPPNSGFGLTSATWESDYSSILINLQNRDPSYTGFPENSGERDSHWKKPLGQLRDALFVRMQVFLEND